MRLEWCTKSIKWIAKTYQMNSKNVHIYTCRTATRPKRDRDKKRGLSAGRKDETALGIPEKKGLEKGIEPGERRRPRSGYQKGGSLTRNPSTGRREDRARGSSSWQENEMWFWWRLRWHLEMKEMKSGIGNRQREPSSCRLMHPTSIWSLKNKRGEETRPLLVIGWNARKLIQVWENFTYHSHQGCKICMLLPIRL